MTVHETRLKRMLNTREYSFAREKVLELGVHARLQVVFQGGGICGVQVQQLVRFLHGC